MTRIPRQSLSGSSRERLGDRAGDDLAAVAQQQRMRGRGGQLLEVVRRHHDRELGLVAGEAVERAEQRLAAREVEPRSRLVEEEEPRPGDERPRDQRALALALRAVAEPPLAERPEPERAEQAVGAVEVELREPLLEVADRRRRSGADHLAHGEERRELLADARVDEADRLAQPGDVGAAHRLAEDLDRAAARELDRTGEREQGRLAGAVRAEEGPALAEADLPADPVEERLAAAARGVPAPDLDVLEPERDGLTGGRRAPLHLLTD